MTERDSAKVEVLKVWYSVFCVIVDAHAEGEMTDAAFIEKAHKLRRELAERVPEVEREFARKRN